jgi:MFS family permease
VATSAVESPAVEPRPLLRRLPFYYGWVNLLVAALAMTATLPGRTHGLGLITEPLRADLNMDRMLYSTLNFWAILLGAAFCLPGGRFLDRFGTRAVLTLVSAALGAVVVFMSGVTGWLTLFAALILVRGLGQGALSVLSTALVGKWFTRRLALAMGIYSVLLAIGFIATTLGVGQAVVMYGWRSAWVGLGVALLCGLAPLSWLLVRSAPENCGVAVEDAARPDDNGQPGAQDASLLAALRTPAFWCFGLATSLFGLMWSAITLYNQSLLEKRGFDVQTFYLVMALLTGSGLLSNLAGGWLALRWPLGVVLAAGMVLFAVCLAGFPLIRTHGEVMIYGLGLGVAGGLITVVHFTFYGQAFGRAHLGQIQGAAQVLSVFASALGPLLLTVCEEQTGSPDLMFFGAALAAVVLGIVAALVPIARAVPGAIAVREGSS